jgi:hypothetical protein
VGAIETVRNKNGQVTKLSCTFVNNCNTWEKDNAAEYETAVIDCRTLKDSPHPMTCLWKAIGSIYGDKGIDCLFISCHSDWEGLYIFSKIRKELGEEDRYVTVNRDWSTIKFNPGANIYIAGCQAGGRYGKKWPTSIAQLIANSSGATVYAFASRSAQRKRQDGGFEQQPDTGTYIEFTPKPVDTKPKPVEDPNKAIDNKS